MCGVRVGVRDGAGSVGPPEAPTWEQSPSGAPLVGVRCGGGCKTWLQEIGTSGDVNFSKWHILHSGVILVVIKNHICVCVCVCVCFCLCIKAKECLCL